MAYAIYLRENANRAKPLHDAIPSALNRRSVGLRAFNGDGMMIDAGLTQPGAADRHVRELLVDIEVSHIHVHNAA